ncbi:MAG: anthrone oxygenase family protein [Ferruginibacter sp.]
MTSLLKICIFFTILFSALVTGLLYGYSCSVNIGLSALPDDQYLRAMQSINNAILNPYFFISFIGLVLLFPITTWLQYLRSRNYKFYYLLIATVIYLAGVFGVTMLGNVPLNNALANFKISLSGVTEITVQRNHFETPWNQFHVVRTIASIVSFSLTIISVLKNNFNK